MHAARTTDSMARMTRTLILTAALLAALLSDPARGQENADDALTALGATPTEGAAADYLPDETCANCHRDKYESFQAVGMSQSLKAPGNARNIETFGEEYHHEASDRYYRIDRQDDGALTFLRYQRDRDGRPLNRVEVPIDWVLGSGNRARSYLYQTDHGELFMLPLSWYSEAGVWRMSPGFEHRSHQGLGRKITRACLFCHNAYPEVPAGADSHWAPQVFPDELPEGIGCQRCHGPGAPHVRAVLAGKSIGEIHDAIVNPADLAGDRRDSVCFQCHMLPSETIEGVRRIGRDEYSFRPGELLTGYIVNIDVTEQGVSPEDRFEINHHAYRFSQSACYRESPGQFTCISCHDPHEKPGSVAMREQSSAVCRDCHGDVPGHAATEVSASDTCIGCHMPTRRTLDVVEVTMTDHRIARGPFDHDALVAPIDKEFRAVTGIGLLDFGEPPSADRADLYRLLAALRANRFVSAARQGLEAHLRDYDYEAPTPRLDLVSAQIKDGDFSAAEAAARQLVADDADIASAWSLLGTALLAQGKSGPAIEAFSRATAIEEDPETSFNLAAAYLSAGDAGNAKEHIDEALRLRPLMGIAWRYRGLLKQSAGQNAEARAAYIRAIEIDPLDTSAYYELIVLLRSTGDDAEARRHLELGLRASGDPARLRSLR